MLDGNFLCDSAIQLRWVGFSCWMGTGQPGLSDERAKNCLGYEYVKPPGLSQILCLNCFGRMVQNKVKVKRSRKKCDCKLLRV